MPFHSSRRVFAVLVLALTIVGGCSSKPGGDGLASESPPALPSASSGGTSSMTTCDDSGNCVRIDAPPGQTPKTGKTPSAKSKAMTADKRLTREEYEEAFADFQACVAASGLELYEVSTSGTYITYSTGVGDAWDDCYGEHFFEPDSFWQIYEHPRSDLTALLEATIECLDGPKIDHPEWKVDVPRRDQAFLYDEIHDFIRGLDDAGMLTKAQSDACWTAGVE